MAYDELPYEVLYFGFGDMGQELNFYLHGEVVDGDKQEHSLSKCLSELAKNIHPPLCKGLGGIDWDQRYGWLALNVGILLASIILFYQINYILLHCRPIVSLPKHFISQ